jgi:hypothetical protein
LQLLKNSVHRNRNFSSGKFWFLETKSWISRKKKSVYRNRIFNEEQNRKLRGEKEPWGTGREIFITL